MFICINLEPRPSAVVFASVCGHRVGVAAEKFLRDSKILRAIYVV